MTKTIKINGNEYIFTCYSWETSRSWGHECILNKNGFQIAKNKVRYYNRTWESYQYQSVMQSCIYSVLETAKLNAVNDWKRETGRKIARKTDKEKIYKSSESVQELTYVYNQL